MTRVDRNVKRLCSVVDQAGIVPFHIVTADTGPGVLEVEMTKRTLVLLSLVVGMGVQAVDWYSMRGTAAGRQLGTTAPVAFGDGVFGPPPKSR
jgi:hypothetical protein